jgi:hypothetical protein
VNDLILYSLAFVGMATVLGAAFLGLLELLEWVLSKIDGGSER